MHERRAFSVAVFCRHGGEILLVRHKRLDLWLPVGGEIEAGETPLEAARRELREETGLEGIFPRVGAPALGVDGAPAGLIGYEEHPAGSKGLHMNFAFVADVSSRELAACDEYTAVRWVGDSVPVECPLNVRQLVRLALAA
ncbi:MAG: NUDIX domain-containing protein [Pseudomonadota bacterium]